MASIVTKSSTTVCNRNVVVLGKTGGGKSTVANRIVETDDGSEKFDVSHAVLTSVTVGASAHSTLLETSDGNFNVQVVDTQGLFDTRNVCNSDIMRNIKRFAREKVSEGFNLILFVFKQGRWTDEEQNTFDYIIKHFEKEISAISALIITGCDHFTETKKKGIIDEFKQKQPRIAAFMQKGIYAVSFPDIDKLKSPFREASERDQKIDQEALRNLVYSCHEMKLTKAILQETFWEKVKNCTIL